MNINQATIDLVKRFEGLRLKSYKDPVGIWTVGYGTTTAAGVGVSVGAGMEITEEQAEEYLRRAMEKFAEQILPSMERKPTENQFGAMLSLAYNIGPGAFRKSTCLRRFNSGDIEGAAEALTWFNKAGGKVLRGLVRRRAAERELFLADDVSVIETPKADAERSKGKSSTIAAAVGAAASGAAGVGTVLSQLDPVAQYIVLGFAGLGALCVLWIVRERIKRWAG